MVLNSPYMQIQGFYINVDLKCLFVYATTHNSVI